MSLYHCHMSSYTTPIQGLNQIRKGECIRMTNCANMIFRKGILHQLLKVKGQTPISRVSNFVGRVFC